MTKDTYKIKHLIWDLLILSGGMYMAIIVGSVATCKHGTGAVLKHLHLPTRWRPNEREPGPGMGF